MGFFIFMGLVVVGALAIVFGLPKLMRRRAGPAIPMLRVGVAAGEDEARSWQQALRSAGIESRVIGGTPGAYRSLGYEHELWVREKDAGRARAILGIA